MQMNVIDNARKMVCDGINQLKSKSYLYEDIYNMSFSEIGVDSIEYISLIVYLEKEIKCKFPDEILILSEKKIEDFTDEVFNVCKG